MATATMLHHSAGITKESTEQSLGAPSEDSYPPSGLRRPPRHAGGKAHQHATRKELGLLGLAVTFAFALAAAFGFVLLFLLTRPGLARRITTVIGLALVA